MRAVVTRVSSASVRIDETLVGSIDHGLLALIGVARDDKESDAIALARKIAALRIFSDEVGVMNRSVAETGGSILVVSQFTLLGDVRHGRRPSFIAAADRAVGEPLIARVETELRAAGLRVQSGRFGAKMAVASVNDGPVTILLDSKKQF